MTAEVAILNNQGVAIAADSAVTMSFHWGEKKTYYTTDKIFQISKKHPVGVMVYNQADFMGINWKILINEYSKQLGEKTFDTLEEYMKNFIAFLTEFKFITEKKQKEYLEYICFSTFSIVKEYYDSEISGSQNNGNDLSDQEKTGILTSAINKRNDELEKGTIVFQDFSGKFIKSNRDVILSVVKEIFDEIDVNEEQNEVLVRLVMLDAQKLESNGLFRHSGVVMVGFGEREIFPAICSTKIFGRLGLDLVHEAVDSDSITDEGQSLIAPFAQTDVINTFLRGIDFELQDRIENLFIDILQKIGLEDEPMKEQIEFFIDSINQMKKKHYTGPILDIVGSLPAVNLAEMAEALINITSLRRHVSTDSETVGGPTDVALITKVDGFVWIKKKNNLNLR
ncbi:MAG: hypothetical protein FWG66_08670 [Spirochaetes bacterium]|nr:hypothetical protein [Spirochaetota bacterium]